MGLQLKLIYQRVCKLFIGKENKPDLDGKIQYFSVQRTGDQLVFKIAEKQSSTNQSKNHVGVKPIILLVFIIEIIIIQVYEKQCESN